MNPTLRFVPKSLPLGGPVAGVQVLAHRSFWLLLPLLLVAPPVLGPTGPFAHLGLAVATLVFMGGAVFAQVAAQVFLTRRFGADVSGVLLFPFGPLLMDSVYPLTVGRRLVVWLAGPFVNLLGGSFLRATHLPLLDAGGGWVHAYGIFSLAPCYPLAGGLILRELLGLIGCSATDADRRTLEVSRVSLCVLAALALLSISLPWLDALLVLWIVGHLALLPGVDLAGVRVTSLQWFQDRWTWLRQRLGRTVNFAVLATILWSRSVEPARAADKPGSQQAQLTAALQAAVQKVCSLESNNLALAARLATLEGRLDETTAHVAAAKSAQCGANQNIGSLATSLAAVARALDDEIQRHKAETAGSIERLSLNQQRLATSQSQLPPRISVCEAAVAQLQQQMQSLEQQGEMLSQSLEAARDETDRALALHDQKIEQVFRALTGLTLIGLAASGLAVCCLYRRIQRLAPGTQSVQEDASFAASSPIAVTAGLSAARPASASEPDVSPISYDRHHISSARSVLTPKSYALGSPGSGSRAGSCSSIVPGQLGPSILGKPIPEPADLLRRMTVLAQRSKGIWSKPSPGLAAPWTIGCASNKGSVRPKNEDYALAFEIAGCQIVLVADGVSGEPLAGPASYLAAR